MSELLFLAELQIRGVLKIIQIFFLFLIENICCNPTLELSQRDGSNDGSKNVFYGVLIIPKFSMYPFLSGALFYMSIS